MFLKKSIVAFSIISIMLAATSCNINLKKVDKIVAPTDIKISVTPIPIPSGNINFALLKDQIPLVKKIADEFTKQNPTVTVNFIEVNNYNYDKTILEKLASNIPIDGFLMKDVNEYTVNVDKNNLAELDGYITAEAISLAEYGNYSTELKKNNKLYALPFEQELWLLYYNKDLFKKAKIPFPKDDITWTAYRKLAKQVSNLKANPKIYGAFMDSVPQSWYMFTVQLGNTILDKNLDNFKSSMQIRLNMEKDQSLIKFQDQMKYNIHYNTRFKQGALAMHINGSWHIKQLIKAKEDGEFKFDWDIASVPHPNGVEPNTTIGNAILAGINAKSEFKDATWMFIKFMCGPEGAAFVAQEKDIPGYINDNIKSILVGENTSSPKNIKILAEQKVHLEYPPDSKSMTMMNVILFEEANKVFMGKQTTDEAIKKIEERKLKEFN